VVEPIIFGTIGAILLLSAYFLELFEHIPPENKWFLLANIAASSFLFYYSYLLDNTVFMIINGVWVLGTIYEMWKIRK
jgi:hypothetical protein